jgi:hypothetical protein
MLSRSLPPKELQRRGRAVECGKVMVEYKRFRGEKIGRIDEYIGWLPS